MVRMTEINKDKHDSPVAVSPAVAEAHGLLLKKGPNSGRFSSAKMFGAAISTLTTAFDGANPLQVEESSQAEVGLKNTVPPSSSASSSFGRDGNGSPRSSSSFARQLEANLRNNEIGIANVPKPIERSQIVTEKQSGQVKNVDQSNQPSQPGNTAPRREITFAPIVRAPEKVLVKPNDKNSNKDTKALDVEREKKLPEIRKVSTVADIEKAREEAARLGVPLVVKFGASWCGPCNNLNRDVFSGLEKNDKSSAVFAHIDIDKTPDGGRAIAKALGIEKDGGVPQVNVLAINKATNKFTEVFHRSGYGGNGSQYKSALVSKLNLLPAEYVVAHRQEILEGLKGKSSPTPNGNNRRRR